ncbi:hypothetical protein [Salinisphaera hydrothermalis]|uniref:t-SNARE coiled-coil homology domain-containing protein n=1 Tax=Salinisphaera hydrothermalis (strain C41B8) TaxID=1304275 RepID=A0A084IJ16_SALHC|nr:hypothetical protein [Salinisphaera hydrothermalis]KEZ76700.1 hypothetical protein C41B8_13835 [Salinisphaera hydrothermalis C41B8]
MRNRTLPLALLIAASLAPVAGCSDGDSDSSIGQHHDRATEQTDSGSSNASRLPVNDPDSTRGDQNRPAQAPSDDPPDQQTQQLAQLLQQVQAMRQAADKQSQRLDDQAQRIDRLEDTVSDLKTRLRRLPQPAQTSPSGKKKTQPSKTPDALSPQAQNDCQPRESQAGPDDGQSAGSGDKASDDDSSEPAGTLSPPADAIGACPSQRDRAHQFDVFFQGASDKALGRAIEAVKSAQLSDWFAPRDGQRLYLGRYDRCAVAARRRDAVHQATDLSLHIAAAQARHPSGAHASRQTDDTDYGSPNSTRSSHSPVTVRSVASAPFTLIGVEIRGTHRFLGVASDHASDLRAITWLSPGDPYAGWQLQALQTDRDRAIFRQGPHTIAVALPDRG